MENIAQIRSFTSELHRAAVEYARDGFPVFPCVPDGKQPACANGFRDATTNIATVDAWWRENPNYNIATEPEKSGYCVLDVEADGLEAWKKFQCENGEVRTFANSTPRGGRHLWFVGSLPPRVKLFNGAPIDTRGKASYVLLPPSAVAGRPYETVDDYDIAPLPKWIAERAIEKKHDAAAAPEGFEFDLPENISRAKHWLANQPVPVQGERNITTFKTACRLKDLGLSPQTVLDMLKPWAGETGPDPFTVEEIEGRVISAFQNGQNAPGNDAVTPSSEAFANLVKNAATVSSSPVHTKERAPPGPALFSDVLRRQVQPVQELIPGLIEKGVATMLAGPGGVHKSRTAVHWGLAISAGLPVYGRATQCARFVFLSYEDHPDEVTRRSQAMTRRLGCEWGDNAEYWDMTGRLESLAVVSDTEGIVLKPFYYRFHDHLRSVEGHKFVVLDSTYNVLEFRGQTKISEAAVKAAINLLDTLCRETDSTILFLWHPSQAGQERGDASGWSVAWHNAPRARVSLSRAEKDKEAFELRVEKRNNAPIGQPITLHWDNGLILPISSLGTDEQAARFLEACVKQALEAAANGAPITKQRHLHDWQIKEIELTCGKRPTQSEVKSELARALGLRMLRYVNGHGRQQAGYYPFEVDPGPFLSGEIMAPSAK